jgi:hypothetical protein
MVLPFGSDPAARAGLAQALGRFVQHLLGLEVVVTPLVAATEVDMNWYVGLDPAGTKIGNALWQGEAVQGSLVGLFELRFVGAQGVLPQVAGQPVYLLMGLDGGNVIRFKPQNLVTGLPLVEAGARAPAMGRA